MHNQETLEHFNKLIVEQIESITGQTHDLTVDEDGDEVDAAQSALIMDMAYGQRIRSNEKLDRLMEALTKIKNKSFGLCEECGGEISVKRLEACLDAKYCISCAELIERNNKAYRGR